VKFQFTHSKLEKQHCCAKNLIGKCQILKSGGPSPSLSLVPTHNAHHQYRNQTSYSVGVDSYTGAFMLWVAYLNGLGRNVDATKNFGGGGCEQNGLFAAQGISLNKQATRVKQTSRQVEVSCQEESRKPRKWDARILHLLCRALTRSRAREAINCWRSHNRIRNKQQS